MNPSQAQMDYFDASLEAVKAAEEAEKRALRAKIRRQRSILIASIIGILITGSLSVVAINQSIIAGNNATKASENEKLAVEALDSLKITIAERDSANYREHLQAGKGLMAEGDRLVNQGNNLAALARFREALSLNYNPAEARASVITTEANLVNDYNKFVSDGDILADAGACSAAIGFYQKALQIKPGEPKLRQKIRDCEKK